MYGYIKKIEIKESYFFWLGLLNSQLFWYYIQQTGYVLRGGYFTFKTNYILPFPVPGNLPVGIVNGIERLAKDIFQKKSSFEKTDTQIQEKMIDNYIYELYDLLEEEIDVIEGVGK